YSPEDTVWECGTFHLIISFTEEYPSSPPKVQFLSRLFHPNVYQDGRICIDILHNQWSAMYDIAAVLTSIQSLLSDPNPQSPANPLAAKLFVNHRDQYDRLV
ncbi:ubiquitin-conjugating enzyme, partial [Cystoisospora suis]